MISMINTMSIYPNGIDKMMFFQDNSLDNIEIINTYENLISQGKYDEANKFLSKQQENVYGFFADYFNALENRIYNLQKYLLTKTKINNFVSSESPDEEPESITGDSIWI